MLVFLPLAPSQCYLLKDVAQEIVPTSLYQQSLLAHSISMQICSSIFLKNQIKNILVPMFHSPLTHFFARLYTKLLQRSLSVYHIQLFSSSSSTSFEIFSVKISSNITLFCFLFSPFLNSNYMYIRSLYHISLSSLILFPASV